MSDKKPKKPEKGSVLTKEDKFEQYTAPEYDDDEKKYLSGIQKRLEKARDNRDTAHTEFDGMTFIDYWWNNESGANTMIEGSKNKGDVKFQSGTLRTKMFAFLSSFQGLNLRSDISAFNKQEILINSLGAAMEDVMDKTLEMENDEEWKMLRQYEMLKHGYVFVEDIWYEKWSVRKDIVSGFFGNKTGVKWDVKKIKEEGRPKRTLLPGPAVYLGSMDKYMLEEQPYIFTIEVIPRSEAEAIYGEWEMWKHVSKEKRTLNNTINDSALASNAWRLTSETNKDTTEIVKYQDKPNNEFQILINGVPMLPLGYPLSAISPNGDYTIVQQNLEPIRHNFAYGKSFIFKNKNIVAVLDQMMKLAVLKTQKSFLPPYLNLSNRIISKDTLMPGKISRGIQPGELVPVSDKEAQGVTAGEFRMIQEVTRFINENTVSPTFSGSKEVGGKVTATQIIELQRQSRMMMGLIVLSASLLEKKLDTKRLMILLEKWFDPIDSVLDESRGALRERYRIVSRDRNIDGEGKGIRMIIPSKNVPSSDDIKNTEELLKKKLGFPARIIILDPVELKQAKLTWLINVNPKEKKSSELAKILFGAMVGDAMNLGLRLNQDYIEDRFAQVWEEDSTKMFNKEQQQEQEQPDEKEKVKKTGAKIDTPQVKLQPKISPNNNI